MPIDAPTGILLQYMDEVRKDVVFRKLSVILQPKKEPLMLPMRRKLLMYLGEVGTWVQVGVSNLGCCYTTSKRLSFPVTDN